METRDVLIVGGGVIGCATAYELSQYKLKVTLVEKRHYLAQETSHANSGVIHTGIDPNPHKLTAKYNILGKKLWLNTYFKRLGFPRQKIRTLIVAFNEMEREQLEVLKQRGIANQINLEDIQMLSKEETLKLEPYVNPEIVAGLKVEGSWAIDPVLASKCLALAAQQNKVQICTNTEVTNISKQVDGTYLVWTNNETTPSFKVKKIIDAAGHYADYLAHLAKADDFEQTTRRGQYVVVTNQGELHLNSMVFMVPTIHGKGVIVSPMLDGNFLVGPTALDGVDKEATRYITKDAPCMLTKIGKHMVPSLNINNALISFAGSRPIDKATNDFIIRIAHNDPDFVILGGMKSPGLTAAPAIAREAVRLLNWKLTKKPNWNGKYNLPWI